MKNNTSNWTEYFIYPGTENKLKAKYRILDGNMEVKLISSVGKGYYASVYNDAVKEAVILNSK